MARSRETGEVKPKARSDAYTGILALSLVAMLIGCALLYLDYSQYPDTKPPAIPAAPAAKAPEGQPMAPPPAAMPDGGGQAMMP